MAIVVVVVVVVVVSVVVVVVMVRCTHILNWLQTSCQKRTARSEEIHGANHFHSVKIIFRFFWAKNYYK